MSFSDLDVSQEYNGNGVTVNFAIPFYYISGEVDVIKVYLDDVLKTYITHYTLDDPTDPTVVQMLVAPALGTVLKVIRETELTQETVITTPVVPSAINKQFDRNVMAIQELDARVTELEADVGAAPATAEAGLAPDWLTLTDYVEFQLVVRDNVLFRALTDHTSGASFSSDHAAGYWEVVNRGTQGPQGDKGDIGDTGATGATGAQGLAGGNGANGIFSAIASQGEAEAGTDNTKGMSPLRVAEAIAAQILTNATVIAAQDDIEELQVDVVELRNDVDATRGLIDLTVGRFSGSQKLKNNHGPQALLGLTAPDLEEGRGSPLQRDGDGSEFAEIMLFIKRYNGTVWRLNSARLVMHYYNATWYIGRDSTHQLVDTLDLDGVTLTVVTDAGTKVGQVWYQTDDMGGDDTIHEANSRIQWLGQEIPLGV